MKSGRLDGWIYGQEAGCACGPPGPGGIDEGHYRYQQAIRICLTGELWRVRSQGCNPQQRDVVDQVSTGLACGEPDVRPRRELLQDEADI